MSMGRNIVWARKNSTTTGFLYLLSGAFFCVGRSEGGFIGSRGRLAGNHWKTTFAGDSSSNG